MEHGKIAKSKNQNQKQFVSVGEASSITGIEAQTTRKMADNASFICYRTPFHQRRINLQSLEEFISNSISNQKISQVSRKNILYARVSSKKQMDDLSRQVEYLKRARLEFFDYELISDVASVINFKRKGLSTILDKCLQGTIGNIVVAHKDRLCRFGFELIKELVQKSGGNIIVLNENKNENKSNEQELSVIQIFCCRQMGKRKYKRAKTLGKLYLTPFQKQKINSFIDTSRYVYNKTLEYLNNGHTNNFFKLRDTLVTKNSKKEIPEIKRLDEKILSLQQLLKSESNYGRQEEISQQIRLIQVEKKETSKKLKSVKNQEIRDFELETPKDIRANAVKQCCDAYKTGYSNLANGNIKFFKMKFRKKSNKKQGIELSKAQISIREGKIRILPSIFKEENILKIHKRIEKKIQKKKYKINNNVDLIRVTNIDYYIYLLLPTNVMEKKPECSKVGGCDLGIRTFATIYVADKSESISIVEYNYRKELLIKLNEKIDLLKRKKRVRRKCFETYEKRKKNFIDVLH